MKNNNRLKRILITGGAGFIGGNLIRKLLLDTDALIFNIDCLDYASDINSLKKFSLSGRHFHKKIDLKNYSQLNKFFAETKPDLVFHLAAKTHVDRSIDNPFEFFESNMLGTFNLLEATRHYWNNSSNKKFFRFIHVSTDEVFGSLGINGKFSETTSYSPRSPYSASKAGSDHLVSAWNHTYGLPTIITNCSNNYGPYQFPEKLIPLCIYKAICGKKIPIYGNGENIRDWLYVEDHIEALILVALKGKIGTNYCIGGCNEKVNKEVVTLICNHLDRLVPNKSSYSNLIEFVKDRPGHDKRYAIDSTKIKNELGWKPKVSFEKGLEKTVIWYLKNKEWSKEIMQISNYKGERLGL
ncbi:MAG: dTDP-glucose 4,6-dehydratase [Euryarchaeota archaeon]|nr:dTDP-glucose 4,6-dehydratase [Euryarchaeota archaeon]|tara:strand:+ start:7039 stop:8100 length:1062 start_codon:yes stop_codon:yes gene_type:complete